MTARAAMTVNNTILCLGIEDLNMSSYIMRNSYCKALPIFTYRGHVDRSDPAS